MSRQRSPRYPAVSLQEAIAGVEKIWSREKRTAVSGEVLAKALGFKSHSGPARSMIGALRQYGLLERSDGGHRLSDRAMTIQHGETEEDKTAAIQEAAIAPDLFRELNTSHPDASSDAIKSHLILKRGFSESGARLAASAFKDTFALVGRGPTGYDGSGLNSLDGDEAEIGRTATPTEPQTVGEAFVNEVRSGKLPGDALKAIGERMGAPLLRQVLVVSIPRNMRVDISVMGDEIKKEDLAKIKSQLDRWIEGLEEAFE